MDWKILMGVPAVIVTVAGIANAVDSRYLHKLAGDAALAQVQKDITDTLARLQSDNEQESLETKLQLYKLELNQLRGKTLRTEDDESRIEYLEQVIQKIQERLDGIAGA